MENIRKTVHRKNISMIRFFRNTHGNGVCIVFNNYTNVILGLCLGLRFMVMEPVIVLSSMKYGTGYLYAGHYCSYRNLNHDIPFSVK